MFFNNLGECQKSFYLGECNNCNKCKISNKLSYYDKELSDKKYEYYFLSNYLSNNELKYLKIEIICLIRVIDILYKELDKINDNK